MSLNPAAIKRSSTVAADQCMARRRTRVLHFINSFEVGGTEIQLTELLKRIDRGRYDVRLACIQNRGALYQEAVHQCGAIPAFPLRRFYDANALAQIVRLRSLLAAQDIDILHAHDFYSGLLGSMAAKLAGVRVLASQRHLKLSDRRVHDWGTRAIHRLSDMVVVNSVAVRDRVLETGVANSQKVVVIPNGLRSTTLAVEVERAVIRAMLCEELTLSEPVVLVATIARLDAVKGHRFLLEAAAALSKNRSLLHYVIIGDGPQRAAIESQASRLGLQDRLHFIGERGDVLEILPGFDLAILPSLHEGFPNAVMESMAAEVPVIATAVGGTPELISHGVTGYLVPAADSAALAGQIAFALDNRELTAAVAARGRQFVVSRFDMDRMVASVQETYDRLMTTGR